MAKKHRSTQRTRPSTRSMTTEVTADIPQIPVEPELPLYKDDTNAFNVQVENDRDFISSVPSEVLDNVLSYLILDHDPDRGLKMRDQGIKFKEHTHVLLSLSAMSRHFRDHVEDFSRRYMLRNKVMYHFKTDAELENDKPRRRSERLKAKPQQNTRVYRKELTRKLQAFCIKCGRWSFRTFTMANVVSCCSGCEQQALDSHVNMSDALRMFDLRDWMLLRSRQPGPRAKVKQTDLPLIPYATVRTGMMWAGETTSYRFFVKDVKAIAGIVHGDVDAHMRKKEEELFQRIAKKRGQLMREVDIECFAEEAGVLFGEEEEYFEQRLEHLRSPNFDPVAYYEEHVNEWYFYDEMLDHEVRCEDGPARCGVCWERAMDKKDKVWDEWWEKKKKKAAETEAH